eukprot:scaffold196750_cov14-Tisochrysis_lutea.AAC.1
MVVMVKFEKETRGGTCLASRPVDPLSIRLRQVRLGKALPTAAGHDPQKSRAIMLPAKGAAVGGGTAA